MLENFGRRRTSGVLALLVAALGLLGMAQGAQAAELSRAADGALSIIDSSNQQNNIDVLQSGSSFYVGDVNQSVTDTNGDSGCSVYSGYLWACGTGITAFRIELGGNNDSFKPNQFTGGNACCFPQVAVTVLGGDGNDTIDGTGLAFSGGGTFEGGNGNDTITGSGFPDDITGGGGSDVMDGAGGSDTILYTDHSQGVTVTLNAGDGNDGSSVDAASAGSNTLDTVKNAEEVLGGSGNDTLIGDNAGNILRGNGGNDTIQGKLGADLMRGGAGRDTVDYSDRSSSQPVTVSLDNIDNDGSSTTAEGDTLGDNEFEVIQGGAGGDTLSATTPAGAGLLGGGGSDRLTAPATGGVLAGEDGDDNLIGGNAGDTLEGGNGNDALNGGGGVDAFRGGEGNDNLTANDGLAETVDCGGGDGDTALTDAVDTRISCDPPATSGGGGGGGGGGGTTTPPPPPPIPLRIMAVTVSYGYTPKFPKANTTFFAFTAKNVPKGSKLVARCVTSKGKKCKGKLGKTLTIKSTKKKTNAIKIFNRKYRPGVQLEVIVSKAGYKTQVKIVQVRKNKIPSIVTRCMTPGSTRRTAC